TPSLVMLGAPHDFSSTTFRPRGPSVTVTASARMLTPRSTLARASALNSTDFAAIARSSYASGSTTQPREAGRSPSSVVASGTRGEHARRPITVAHEPPRLAP